MRLNKINIIVALASVLVITTMMFAGCSAKAADTSQAESPVIEYDNDDDGEDVDVVPAKAISEDGEYTLTGKIDGQILVTAEDVTLILDSAEISCEEASAILGKDGNGADIQQNLTVELRGESTITSGAKHGIQGKDDLTITGTGTVNVSAVKDGLHAGDTLTVKDGTINILESYEGMEATNIVISGGNSTVNSSDDGLNATASEDDGKVTPSIKITDGTVILYTESDGIDSNGTLEVTGGTVGIFINVRGDGDPTDTERGGSILPAIYGEAQISGGPEIAVSDLWKFTVAKDATKFCLILPGLVEGQSYEISAGGQALSEVTATAAIQGMTMGGGDFGGGDQGSDVKGFGGAGGGGKERPEGTPPEGGRGQKPAGSTT
ncbi:MAG: carbohydrate-binding domain-containing protein [Clostridiales Family XIII bacterium]|jgi:hypothetical protein|nr:carbohydrate-binding domain-containing protein [Clostridiales Family XIII bacterium]